MTDRTDAELIKSYLEKIDALEVKLAATQGAHEESLVQLLATLDEIATLENRLRISESDSDENYIQGVRRGGFTAINTIIAMPLSDDHSRGDRVTQYFVREDCIEAIREAIQKTTDAARVETADGGEEE